MKSQSQQTIVMHIATILQIPCIRYKAMPGIRVPDYPTETQPVPFFGSSKRPWTFKPHKWKSLIFC